MSLFPPRMKKIQSKTLECSQHFSHCKSMGNFSDAQGQLTLQSMVGSGRIMNSSETLWLSLNSAVHGPIRHNLEFSPDFMVVLVTCKNENDSIKNERTRVVTTLYIDFSDTQGQLTA